MFPESDLEASELHLIVLVSEGIVRSSSDAIRYCVVLTQKAESHGIIFLKRGKKRQGNEIEFQNRSVE